MKNINWSCFFILLYAASLFARDNAYQTDSANNRFSPNIPMENGFSGLAEIDSSSLEFPPNIHDSHERRRRVGNRKSIAFSQRAIFPRIEKGCFSSEEGFPSVKRQRGKPKCEEYMSAIDGSSMDHNHAMSGNVGIMRSKPMHGTYGHYPMNRDSSGTSWQPDSTPMSGIMFMPNEWVLMLNGFANIVFDQQGGPRGSDKIFSSNMLMFMGQKDFRVGTFGFHSMISLDPLMGKSGYPLLFQTGETADGITPLIDRQHPHDLFMELAATYSIPLSDHISIFGYAGLPGEPALGPPAFMHRWSAMYIPEAPLSHHWLDSTHITYGVTTLGFIRNKFKLEASAFKGREPDQFRWNIESAKLDSNSFRLSYNPNENWSLQISRGHIVSPEQLHPGVNTNRTTASASYNRPFNSGSNWQTTFAWGQNANNPGHRLDGYLLESTFNLNHDHTFFGRIENVEEDELLHDDNSLAGDIFRVNKLSLGYIYNFPKIYTHLQASIGGLISTYLLPGALKTAYGNSPISYMLFGRISLE